MATFILTSDLSSLTAIPGQDITFSVTTSANYSPADYLYQWKVGSSNIAQQTSSSYSFDALMNLTGNSYTVSVSALSGAELIEFQTSSAAVLTVNEDVPPFAVFDVGSETGKDRHRRLRLLGYI